MQFLRRADAAAPAIDSSDLALIDLFTTNGRRLGWIATNGWRTSDWMNATEPMPVLGAVKASPAERQADLPPLPGPSPDELTLEAEDILFAIPSPLPPNRHLRLHRRRVHVELRVGDVTIGGQAHVRPGAQATDHIFRSGRRFVPLTDVELITDDVGSAPWVLPVVIVNTSHVAEVRGLDTPQPAVSAVAAVEEPLATSESEPVVTRNAILLTALELLLAENIIDVVEFQSKRAALLQD